MYRCTEVTKIVLPAILTKVKKLNMSIKAALIDLSGTLHIDDEPTPNAVDALERLRNTGIAIKFVTNTTKESRKTLNQRLELIGFKIDENEIYSSLTAAVSYVKNQNLNPLYLLSEDARNDFPPTDEKNKINSVVVGLAPNEFHYEKLNEAFNVLLSNKEHRLVAIHQGKYYKRKDGLALGPGFFVKGLEYATGAQADIIGKPNSYFFKSAIPQGVTPEECVMIGDDPNDDVMGAMNAGLKGILVKTGKYLPDVVVNPPPTAVLDNFSFAVNWIIKNNAAIHRCKKECIL